LKNNKELLPLSLIIVVTIISGCINEKQNINNPPDFTLEDINGKVFNLSDFFGKVILIDFMATWCTPCKSQMGVLSEIKEELGEEITIISIDVDKTRDNPEKIRSTFGNYIDKWIFAMDNYEQNVGEKYMVSYIPKIVIINEKGKISYSETGLTDKNTLLNEINKAKNK